MPAQAFSKGGDIWFGLPVQAGLTSVVTLVVAADNLTLITNASPGRREPKCLRTTCSCTPSLSCTWQQARCGAASQLSMRLRGAAHSRPRAGRDGHAT